MSRVIKALVRRVLPAPVHRQVKLLLRGSKYQPSVGQVRFGDLRRVTPISDAWYERGRPVDRYYIEGFLERHAGDIRGRVLEVGDDKYTRSLGGGRVTRGDVLHVAEGNPQATIVADITRANNIPSGAFDCVIFTQTLHLIYEARAAVQTLRRIIKPGGVLLVTVPGISQIDRAEWREVWCWGFTTYSARRLFGEVFPAESVSVESHGNVLAATAFLHGLADSELRREELDYDDAAFQLVITVRAVRPEGSP
jgi:SAM-dependent methyltransferase